jgi:hypothetical protein
MFELYWGNHVMEAIQQQPAEPAEVAGGGELPTGCEWHKGYEPVSQHYKYIDCYCSACEQWLINGGASSHPAPELAELRAETERLTKNLVEANGLLIRQTAASDAFSSKVLEQMEGLKKAVDDASVRCAEQIANLTTRAETAERELDAALKDAAAWKEEWQMYANAWKREVSGFIPPKTHLIDALVLATRELKKRREETPEPPTAASRQE